MTDQLYLTVKRCLERYRFFSLKQPLVVAVSTGVDSMTLLQVLNALLPANQVVVAHVNHHLRAQSQQEEQFLRQRCQQMGVRLYVDQWEKHPQHGIENAARQERYRFFAQVMHETKAAYLLTAHHENDLAETMLMKLLRTGDVTATVGIREARPFANGQLLRPFLRVTKKSLIEYARAHQLKWYEDATNHENMTLRNRVRHHYLPEWEQENPRMVEHLLKFHDQLTELLTMKDAIVTSLITKLVHNGQLDIASYQQQEPLIRRWLLYRWINDQGMFDLQEQRSHQIDHFLCNQQSPSSTMMISSDLQLIKNYQRAELKKVQNLPTKKQKVSGFMVKFDHWYTGPAGEQWGIFSHPQAHTIAEVWLASDQLPLRARPWQATDRIRLKSGHHQAIRRVLINQKVPLDQRQQQLVVVDRLDQVLWLIGHKTAWLDRQQVRDQRYEKRYFCQK